MANKYPDSVLITGQMVPCVRTALIAYKEKLREDLISHVNRDYFQLAFDSLNEANLIHEFLLSLDKSIQFDDDEEAPF